ncbi:MAG: hydrogenase formation protein HypD [Nannocystaceae bacterium]
MKWVDEYRDPAAIRAVAAAIAAATTRPWTIMEVCGGQTHTIVRWSLPELLPPMIELVHGPGCPVCVTPAEILDQARALALREGAVLATFGDMMRVPGEGGDLLAARAEGADVRIVTSPLDALDLARGLPGREVVLLAVGFETTAPATAATIELAAREGLANFSALTSHVRVPPAMAMILGDDAARVQGFLAAGHVCTIVGTGEYPALVERFGVPIVVTGFEPLDLLEGLLACVRQLEAGRAEVEIQYRRAVRPEGNPIASAAVLRVFEIVDAPWRGLGVVPSGGLRIREAFARHDAVRRFELAAPRGVSEADRRCRAAEVLRGPPRRRARSSAGAAPRSPPRRADGLVRGACAAYWRHGRADEGPIVSGPQILP